jgi:hypothetical protein
MAVYGAPFESAETVAAVVCESLVSDGFERYVPDLKSVAEFKTADIDAFMQGAVDYFASQEQLVEGSPVLGRLAAWPTSEMSDRPVKHQGEPDLSASAGVDCRLRSSAESGLQGQARRLRRRLAHPAGGASGAVLSRADRGSTPVDTASASSTGSRS